MRVSILFDFLFDGIPSEIDLLARDIDLQNLFENELKLWNIMI